MDRVDARALKECYDGFHKRLHTYQVVLDESVLCVDVQSPKKVLEEFRSGIRAETQQMSTGYDEQKFRAVEEFVAEVRQDADWPNLRCQLIRASTALDFSRQLLAFMAEAWKSDTRPILQIFGGIGRLVKKNKFPTSYELLSLLREEHTLARRALKAMAVPPVKPDDPAPVEPSRQQKLKSRDKQIKLLCKTHNLARKWAELVKVVNDDPIIKQLGLKPVTKDIARNVMIPPQRRHKK